MKPINFDRANRICGESQGYIGLPIMDSTLEDGRNVMLSMWRPSAEELASLVNGACVFLWTIGNNPQPVNLEVGYE